MYLIILHKFGNGCAIVSPNQSGLSPLTVEDNTYRTISIHKTEKSSFSFRSKRHDGGLQPLPHRRVPAHEEQCPAKQTSAGRAGLFNLRTFMISLLEVVLIFQSQTFNIVKKITYVSLLYDFLICLFTMYAKIFIHFPNFCSRCLIMSDSSETNLLPCRCIK